MTNLIKTVHYYEDLRRLTELKTSGNLEEISEIAKRISHFKSDKINQYLLKDLQLYGDILEHDEELVICVKDLIYSVGNDNQTKIDIKLRDGECFRVTDYGYDTITFKSFNDRLTIRMKKKTFRYYFGVINSRGKSNKEFFNSKIFREMEE